MKGRWKQINSERAGARDPAGIRALASRHGRCQSQMVTLTHLFSLFLCFRLFCVVVVVFFCVRNRGRVFCFVLTCFVLLRYDCFWLKRWLELTEGGRRYGEEGRKGREEESESERGRKKRDKWLEEENYSVYTSRLMGGHTNLVLLIPCYTLARSCHRFPCDKKYCGNL